MEDQLNPLSATSEIPTSCEDDFIPGITCHRLVHETNTLFSNMNLSTTNAREISAKIGESGPALVAADGLSVAGIMSYFKNTVRFPIGTEGYELYNDLAEGSIVYAADFFSQKTISEVEESYKRFNKVMGTLMGVASTVTGITAGYKAQKQYGFSRRTFLKVAGITGVTAALTAGVGTVGLALHGDRTIEKQSAPDSCTTALTDPDFGDVSLRNAIVSLKMDAINSDNKHIVMGFTHFHTHIKEKTKEYLQDPKAAVEKIIQETIAFHVSKGDNKEQIIYEINGLVASITTAIPLRIERNSDTLDLVPFQTENGIHVDFHESVAPDELVRIKKYYDNVFQAIDQYNTTIVENYFLSNGIT